ncbi:unnamed protein product [Calypogeia fissa]
MEEGMGTTTINDYLTYVPVGVVRHGVYTSGTRTTHPAHPRDLVGVDIVSWETFAESVQRECERASAQQSDEKLEPLLEKNRAVSFVQNEAGLERALDNRLFMPLQRLLCKVGVNGEFVPKPSSVILDPDWSWQSTDAQGKGISVDKILIEVKTFWAFDAPDDLVETVKSGLLTPPSEENKKSIAQKAVRAVSQLYGYLSINHLQYGVLCTFDKYYFMRRLDPENGNARSCGKLEITTAIRRDQTRVEHRFTLMEAWLTIMMAAESSYVITSPYASPAGKKTKPRKPLELDHDFKLGNFFFGSRLTRSQLGVVVDGGVIVDGGSRGIVVDGGLQGTHVPDTMLKIVDTGKAPGNGTKLQLEVSAYKALKQLQNRIVPEVIGFFLIHGWIMVLVMRKCGKDIEPEQFLENFQEIKSMFEEIHGQGVAHGDIALRNIVINDTTEKVTIIDFSEAHLRSLCSAEEFEGHCKKDLDAMEGLRHFYLNLE